MQLELLLRQNSLLPISLRWPPWLTPQGRGSGPGPRAGTRGGLLASKGFMQVPAHLASIPVWSWGVGSKPLRNWRSRGVDPATWDPPSAGLGRLLNKGIGIGHPSIPINASSASTCHVCLRLLHPTVRSARRRPCWANPAGLVHVCLS